MTADGPKAKFRQRLFARFMRGTDDLSHELYREKKEPLFKEVRGRVLEIGPGTGVNLCFFPQDIEWIGIEPNPAMHPLLREQARKLGLPVKLHTALEESAGIEKESIDYVVSTTVLCSVKNLEQTLAQIRGVLKPGGTFLFLEHVVDRHNKFRRFVQKVMPYTPWRYFSDGCDPGRDIAAAINSAGFTRVEFHHYYQHGQGVLLNINRPHIYGRAVK